MTSKKSGIQKTTFHEIAKTKGWRLIDIGARWGVSERQMSRIANNPSQKDIDAVSGLPEYGEIIIRKPKPKISSS